MKCSQKVQHWLPSEKRAEAEASLRVSHSIMREDAGVNIAASQSIENLFVFFVCLKKKAKLSLQNLGCEGCTHEQLAPWTDFSPLIIC